MPRTASPTTVVISCEDDQAACDGAVGNGVTVVSPEFILSGILRQEVDLNSYPLSSTTWGWSFHFCEFIFLNLGVIKVNSTLKMMSDTLTNTGKHVISNSACTIASDTDSVF